MLDLEDEMSFISCAEVEVCKQNVSWHLNFESSRTFLNFCVVQMVNFILKCFETINHGNNLEEHKFVFERNLCSFCVHVLSVHHLIFNDKQLFHEQIPIIILIPYKYFA